MDIIEILKNIIIDFTPEAVIVILTAIITKHYNKQPNEKLEISYNRIYYPLYKIVIDNQNKKLNEIDYIRIRNNLKSKLQRYDKYANRTTIKAYQQFDNAINHNNKRQIRYVYENLIKEDIFHQNSSLRRILGYPEPNFFQRYRYSPKEAKFQLRNIILIISTICSIYFYSIYHQIPQILRFSMTLFGVSIILLIINVVIYFGNKLWNLILNRFST